jgi:hypothetical protein
MIVKINNQPHYSIVGSFVITFNKEVINDFINNGFKSVSSK